IQLFFELYFVLFLYVYSFLTNDFSSFISGIVVVSTIFVVQIFFEEGAERSWSLYLLAPIGWLLFYITTVVEYNTLIKSLWGSVTHQAVTWQRWERKGCLDEFVST
ncbi:MAG: hypothetical protein ACREGH_02935, partial [Minisyncoccia bacterium]